MKDGKEERFAHRRARDVVSRRFADFVALYTITPNFLAVPIKMTMATRGCCLTGSISRVCNELLASLPM